MKNTKIEWADHTWNPVTGCRHGCDYCYARGMVNRFGRPGQDGIWTLAEPIRKKDGSAEAYPYGFDPTFYGYRLDNPRHWVRPSNIFVCSMADLFGEWVPDDWIRMVFETAVEFHRHNYLFLTKNPERYADWKAYGYYHHFWFGTTVTSEEDAWRARALTEAVPHANTFISLEPMLGKPDLMKWDWDSIDWIIIGAMSGPGSEKHKPNPNDVWSVAGMCMQTHTPCFFKDSLAYCTYEGKNGLWEFPEKLRKEDE